ncbi:hypothetical protein ATE84_2889 [Aquimarina sp. MAR_2010_214]|nr:hypothetical protein ATE84_2889 [Aquimarina sp. MAR_2010_214]
MILWMVLLLGGSTITLQGDAKAENTAPSPALPVSSPYITMDRPDNRPVIGVLPLNQSNDLIVGTDEAIYLYSDHHYIKTLPYMLWEPMFQAGDYIYASVNHYNRKAMRANRVLYRTRNGKDWQRITKGHKTPDLFAVDIKNDMLYGASRDAGYHSTLSVLNMRTGQIALLGDKRLRRIEAIGWFQGGLYVQCDRDKLYVSHDGGNTFTDITKDLGGGTEGYGTILVNEHYLVLSIAGHYLYVFDGKKWKEMAAHKMKHGAISFYRIQALKHHQLVVTQLSRNLILDLRTGKERDIHLPKVYKYSAFTLVGDHLMVSAQLPKDNMLTIALGSKAAHTQQAKAAQLLNISLEPENICQRLLGTHHYTMLPSYRGRGSGIIIDSSRIYINGANKILDVETKEQINQASFHRVRALKRGAVHGDWFMGIAEPASSKTKGGHPFFHLHRSKDKGKTWDLVTQKRQVPYHVVIDDSLQLAYYLSALTIERIDLRPSYESTRHFEMVKGTPKSLIIDKTSRLWMQSSEGIFVSKATGGWWQCPLPFRDNPSVTIRDFALLDQHMAVTYKNQLYVSPNHKVDWKATSIIDPCTHTSLPVRIVGSSDTHIILEDRIYGHLWVININTQSLQKCHFPKTFGAVRKAHYANGKLLVETTGTPIQSTAGRFKNNISPALLQYQLK